MLEAILQALFNNVLNEIEPVIPLRVLYCVTHQSLIANDSQ